MKRLIAFMFVAAAGLFAAADSEACTGISLSAKDGSRVVARTVEWSASSMQCGYVVARADMPISLSRLPVRTG